METKLLFQQKHEKCKLLAHVSDCILMATYLGYSMNTPDRWQLKTLIISTNIDLRLLETDFFDCRLSPDWRQTASKTLFLAICDPHSSIIQSVFDCHLSDMIKECVLWYLKWFSHFAIKHSHNILTCRRCP